MYDTRSLAHPSSVTVVLAFGWGTDGGIVGGAALIDDIIGVVAVEEERDKLEEAKQNDGND